MGNVAAGSLPDWMRQRVSFAEQRFSPAASTFFDLIRFVSAVLVVMEHLASRLFVGYGYLETPGLGVQILYLLNLLGGPSVIVFFVLSGLFISRTVYRSYASARGWAWRDYLIPRFSRLYVVLIPALALTWLLDIPAVENGWVSKSSGLNVLIGNLLYLQTIAVPQYGSNAPLWSLSNEFWYYMAFPILLGALFGSKPIMKFIYVIVFVLMLWLIGMNKSLYFIHWTFGAFILILPMRSTAPSISVMTAAVASLVGAFLLRPIVARGRLVFSEINIPLFWPDLLVALTAAVTIYLAWGYFSQRGNLFGRKIDCAIRAGASFSFSLYLIHYPIINCAYYVAKNLGWVELQPSFASVGLEIVIVAIICISAWGFAKCTESQTGIVRDLFRRRLRTESIASRTAE